MGAPAKKLTEFRRQEQEMRGYAASSRWYTGLSNAIHFLERAEGEGDYLDRFRDAWSAAYNLFVMHGKAGDDEHKCFNRWVTILRDVPSIRRFFSEAHETEPFSVFRANVKKARKTLLKPQGRQELYAWNVKPASADKACRYFLTICRDIRNTCSHPDFNPKAAAIKKALASAADCLVPVVAAAIKATIEHPVEGSTGRTTAYRSFLWPFLKNSDSFFSDYYLEKLFPEEELEAIPEDVARAGLKTIARQIASMRSGLINADADETKEKWCKQALFPILGATLKEGVRIVTEDGVSQPTFVLPVADLKGEPRTEYQGKDAGRDLACLTWVLPWKTSLDSVAIDPEFKNLPVIEMAHKVLNLSNVPWAVLTNGRKLRLLSKRTAHKPRCFLEIDLQSVADRRGDAEARQAFRYFLGLFSAGSFTEKDDQDNTRLDRVLTGSERHGKEIGDELKQNVFKALEELGDGFLHYLRSISPDELDMWRKEKASSLSLEEYLASDQLLTEIYHESLSLMYRLLFLFYAESRNLLPMDDEMYRETYSLESIRDDIISIHDDPDTKRFFGKGHTDLWDRLKELFVFVNKGWRNVIPAYNGGLFDPDLHEFLERFKVDDYHLARAIDLLSRTKPRAGQARGEGRKKVTYRDLDIRHLGSIYEGILEYAAQIADQDLVVLKRGSGNKVYEEYVPVSELKNKEMEQFKSWREAKEENPENPKPPRGCRIMGEKTSGQYFLVCGGRESKRKSSGSYYTPDYIVQYIVEDTLGPLVRGECRPKPEPLSEELKKLGIKDEPAPTGRLTSDEILELKVLDPAMGSGHFLVAATEYLARAYGEALIRESKDDDGVISDDEFIRYKRIVAERCIYGVDINPVAVELAKLSMWLFTMDKGRPLSFLDHHLKCGNSLIGAWIKDLGALPEFDKKGRPKKVEIGKVPATQMNLFETRFKEKLPLMIRDLLGIMKNETLTPDDIKLKKDLDKAVEDVKRPFKNIADAWVGTYFGDEVRDYERLLSNVALAKKRKSKATEEHGFFHWELEFPDVFFDHNGNKLTDIGFSVVMGNPPYRRERDAIDLIRTTRCSKLGTKYHQGKMDYWYYFSHLALSMLKKKGLHSLIVPIYW
ncbi:MAG: DNA methyltransferase, partial [Thermodesulfobacteriota bacterium]|nr:DNA methyltransferase [Thermodesulfobacteriota bacterium]